MLNGTCRGGKKGPDSKKDLFFFGKKRREGHRGGRCHPSKRKGEECGEISEGGKELNIRKSVFWGRGGRKALGRKKGPLNPLSLAFL